MHWANLDGRYSRNIESWQPMCPKCHYEFDGTTVNVQHRWEKFTGKKAIREDGKLWQEIKNEN